jgi:hypothetical protein
MSNQPLLSYIASSDIASLENGSTAKFQIFFDSALLADNNVIMFEYKITSNETVNPDLDNTSFAYISVENATQTAIQNQYTLAIPIETITYNGSSTHTIAARVYFGSLVTQDVVVTEWSDPLPLYVAPAAAVVLADGSFYDPSFNTDSLFVLLKIDGNVNNYDYDTIKFIVCYFFKNSDNTTTWGVSPILSAETAGAAQYKRIQVDNIGTVSSDTPVVYFSIHAVYTWHFNDTYYHACSYMSNEGTAISSSSDNTPTITFENYNIYESSREQTVSLEWTAPPNAFIPRFAVSYYKIYVAVDNSDTYVVLYDNIETLSYKIDLTPSWDSFSFKVSAFIDLGYEVFSTPTDFLNKFVYADAVTNLTITEMYLQSNGNTNLTISFTGLSSNQVGNGTPQAYQILINDSVVTPDNPFSADYVDGQIYNLIFSGVNILKEGVLSVSLGTSNTNPEPDVTLYGATSTVNYISNNVELSLNYLIYSERDQTMDLSWDLVESVYNNWSLNGYNIYYSTSSIDWRLLNENPHMETTYSYNLPSDFYMLEGVPITTDLNFKVVAIMTLNNDEVSYNITSNVVEENTFTYANEVTNLDVSTVYNNNTGLTTMVVSFTGVSNTGVSNKGNGDAQNYIITINDEIYIPSEVLINEISAGGIVYTSGALYRVTYNSLEISNSGNIYVYLQTNNTNAEPTSPLDGETTFIPYVSNSVLLNAVNYNVYNDNTQNMDFSWNVSQEADGWNITSYTVQLSIDEATFEDVTTITSTNYRYAVTLASSTQLLEFRIKLLMTNILDPSKTYIINSNTESKYTFSYSSDVTDALVNYVVVNHVDNTNIFHYQFKAPVLANQGINNGIVYFTSTITDGLDSIIETDTTNYDVNTTTYIISRSSVPYSANGTIELRVYVRDTNSADVITSGAYYINRISYIASRVPFYNTPLINSVNNTISGTIITHDVLKPTGVLMFNGRTSIVFFDTTVNNVNLINISNNFANDVYTYAYTILSPNSTFIAVSNNAGISSVNFRD